MAAIITDYRIGVLLMLLHDTLYETGIIVYVIINEENECVGFFPGYVEILFM